MSSLAGKREAASMRRIPLTCRELRHATCAVFSRCEQFFAWHAGMLARMAAATRATRQRQPLVTAALLNNLLRHA